MLTRTKKLISMLIIFVIVFTYSGETLNALATTDAISVITNGFFNNGEMKFRAYFDGENTEKISEVNEKSVLTFEIEPSEIGQGFLKEGIIEAVGADGSDNNFKFSKIKSVVTDEPEDEANSQDEIENEVNNVVSNEIEEVPSEEQEEQDNTVIENEVIDNSINNDVVNETAEATNEVSEDTITENVVEDEIIENQVTENTVENEVSNTEVVSRSNESRESNDTSNVENTEELINEDEVIENIERETEESYEELTAQDFEVEITNDNQIKVQNVIYKTTIEVEIEYNQKEEVTVADLYKEIQLRMTGTYININLEKIQTTAEEKIKVGWEYEKEISVEGEYTQVSPFKLGEHQGTLVESKIKVKRDIEEEKYLPIKEEKIEIDVPEYNGNKPETVNVQATKLMATKGQDLGGVEFSQDNWNYDAESGKITIKVTNENDGKAVNSVGEDEYLIIYRYNDYTEDEKIKMDLNVNAEVEEYSAENKVVNAELHATQEIGTEINNLITYNIATTESDINKAKINANYNSDEATYETEYTTSVTVNILTSDLIEELKVNSTKEEYIDVNGTQFDASNDVYYKKVKFNYDEIKNVLQNGGTIEIQNKNGEVLSALTNENITNQDNCEITLGSKEYGVNVVYKNISTNGSITVEFVKEIGKSGYEKSAFANFKKVKSYAKAEIRYTNYEEQYEINEISVEKEFSESKTIAEISLTNNNLNTISKNDGVEVKIALNNDKQDTDLYINPSFELVFPKYVKNVSVESMNVLYGNGLQVSDFQTYTENDIVKMRLELEGIQKTFSDSQITNGTNIVLSLNIELDEYTPRKVDQIKMYYCNEGVTNYESQTKWTISKGIPNGIIKQTNGFDVTSVNYQAPNGLITANTIINYDGQASKIKSVSQGEKTAEIEKGKPAQISTMELVAMNNTDNKCTDTVFIGRIPYQGNKSVITGKDLGTTASTRILGEIKENIQNVNMATIYYSSNEKATKDLENEKNGWTTSVADWQTIKSYMIVVKGEMEKGTVLRYTYDFEIPGNLDYSQAIYGSFGGYYNNHYASMVSYESTEADKVGVVTEKEPDNINSDSLNKENTVNENEDGENYEVSIEQKVVNEIYYYNDIEYHIKIKNNGVNDINVMVVDSFPKLVNIMSIQVIIDNEIENNTYIFNNFSKSFDLNSNSELEIIAKGTIIDWDDTNVIQTIENIVELKKDNGDIIDRNLCKTIVYPKEEKKENLLINNIFGTILLDNNKDGVNDLSNDELKEEVEINLIKDSKIVDTQKIDISGKYSFCNLENGKYRLEVNIDSEKYEIIPISENESQCHFSLVNDKFITDELIIENGKDNNINIHLKEKEKFDLSMKQYITKATVNIDGEETEYAYEDLDLAKVEMNPSVLENASVKFEYKLVVENVGNVAGKVTSIVDYLPNGLTFNESENDGWTRGVNGNLYTDLLKNVEIEPGETQEVKLVLNKKMTEDNTGVISNKAQIAYTQSETRLSEAKGNNFASQETIVTVTQGGVLNNKVVMVFTISLLVVVSIFGYMVQTGKLEISLNMKKGIKKVYK